MPRGYPENLVGRTFGRLSVTLRLPNKTRGRVHYLCQCACGGSTTVDASDLRTGKQTGCSCVRRDFGKRKRKRPYESLYNALLRTAHKRGIEDVMAFEEFLSFTCANRCTYCRTLVMWSEFNIVDNGQGYNLDRKENSIGYTVDNSVVCCKRCNWTKNDQFTFEEWMQMTTILRENNNYDAELELTFIPADHSQYLAALTPEQLAAVQEPKSKAVRKRKVTLRAEKQKHKTRSTRKARAGK